LRRCGKQNHGLQGLLRLLCKGKRLEWWTTCKTRAIRKSSVEHVF
jgi:hypothetical protein